MASNAYAVVARNEGGSLTNTMLGWVGASRRRLGAASAVLAFLTLLMSVVVTGQSAQAQTLSVLYAFTGGADGQNPSALIRDGAGNLYATSGSGGVFG